MTTTLITGKGGTPHITSGDMAPCRPGHRQRQLPAAGQRRHFPHGDHAGCESRADPRPQPRGRRTIRARHRAETATIESGMSGQNRNDLVCLKYTRNSQNIETAAIAVLKGTPNTGTPPTRPSRRAASTRPPTRRGSRSPASRSAGSRPARRSCSSNSCLPCRNCGIP